MVKGESTVLGTFSVSPIDEDYIFSLRKVDYIFLSNGFRKGLYIEADVFLDFDDDFWV